MRRLASTSRHIHPRHRRALFLEQLEDRRVLATFTVNTLADTVDANPAITSLREATLDANSQAGDDIIQFDSGVAGTITLTSGELAITDAVDLQGPGSSLVTVSGNYASRVFHVSADANISGLTISGGSSDYGGGIYNAGTLTVSNSNVSDNYASGSFGQGSGLGGGIYNGGALIISNSTLSGNSTGQGTGGGGAIYNVGFAAIKNSTLSSNHGGKGGGIYNSYGSTVVSRSTLSHNFASFDGGGGIYNYVGSLEVSNSTLSANNAWGYGGGGIFNAYGSLEVSNSTISDNNQGDGGWGGGIAGDGSYPTLNNTIVANNLGGDIFDSFTGSNNLFGSVDLGPLQDNGGPTQTHALPADSPAINAGDNSLVPIGVVTDQRGLPRFRGTVDIGAFEFQPAVQTVTVDIRPESLNVDSNGTLSVVIFGAADFDATLINVSTVQFAGAGVWQSTLVDANGDGFLDLQVKFRTQDTILDQIYADLLLDDEDADGILDSTRQSARVAVTGETLDETLFSGSDNITLFLAGRSLRNLLDELFG